MSGSDDGPSAAIILLAGVHADHLTCFLRKNQGFTSAGRHVNRLPRTWPPGNSAAEAAAAAAATVQAPSGPRGQIDHLGKRCP
eukprot:7383337-Pyramimonas_sp.AAC.1